MKIHRVKQNTCCIDTCFSYIGYYRLNNKDIVLLDTGWYQQEGPVLQQFFHETGYRAAYIILSHAHEDHMGNVKTLQTQHGAKAVLSRPEALYAKNAYYMKQNYNEFSLTRILEIFDDQFFDADIILGEADESVVLSDASFRIVPTPGHSAGHIAIITPDNVAFLGDLLLSSDVISRTKLPYSMFIGQDLESKWRGAALDCDAFILSHNAVVTDVEACLKENLDFFQRSLHRAFDLLEEPATVDQIIARAIAVLGFRASQPHRFGFFRQTLMNYIQYLEDISAIMTVVDGLYLQYQQQNRQKIDEVFEGLTQEKKSVIIRNCK